MTSYNNVVELFAEMDKIAIDGLREFAAIIQKENQDILNIVEQDIERCKATGVLTYNGGTATEGGRATAEAVVATTASKRVRGRPQRKNNHRSRSSSGSLKENELEEEEESRPTVMRSRKNVFIETSQLIAEQTNSLVNSKSEQSDVLKNVVVKVENISEEFIKKHGNGQVTDIQIKKEMMEMPPPSRPPVKQTRKRKITESTCGSATSDVEDTVQVKLERIERASRNASITRSATLSKQAPTSRDSDIEVNVEKIDTIVLIDSDEDAVEKEREKKSVKPRGRTKRKAPNKEHSESSDDKTKTSDEDKTVEIAETARVTRTKTRNAAKAKEAEDNQEATTEKQKRLPSSSTSAEDELAPKKTGKSQPKRTKTRKVLENKHTENENSSIYEDARSDNETTKKNDIATDNEYSRNSQALTKHAAILNATVTIQKPKITVLNETVVISKMPNGDKVLENLMTDDEDIVVSPAEGARQKAKKMKQVFSPYENSPVKKRVEAFEKLGAEVNGDMPPRMTRTKTNAKEQKEKANIENGAHGVIPKQGTGAIPKLRGNSSAIPKLQSTPVMDHRILLNPSKSNSTLKASQAEYRERELKRKQKEEETPINANSALKASQTEFRERELRRKQKEEEAALKKEALMQALQEERRRKREERQLKAQQTRDAIEKDKQKMLELAERAKQEKLKQMLAEREEKLLKQREEASRKRALALKKANEEKQKEEKRKMEEQMKAKKMSSADTLPPYLKYKAPLLPTADCYDSDDSNADKEVVKPSWQTSQALSEVLRCMRYVDSQKRNLFIMEKKKTVDLKEIFPSIEPSKLKRTSSAIWNKSGLTKLASMCEENEDDV